MTAEIFSDTVCALGEGPAAHPALGRLFWFDILGKRMLERPFDRSGTTVHDLPFMASVMAVIDDRRQLIASETGLHVRDMRTGALAMHTPIEADDPDTRSNDGRVHPCGALWVGTMSRTKRPRAGALYWFFRGELRRLFDGISIINSICFSADGRIAYFADTVPRTIWRVETDPETGLPAGEPRVFVQFGPEAGGPDGSVTDLDGVVWNARWGAGSVDGYAPDGRRIRSVAVPAIQSSCPAFVGADASRLAVTSAAEDMDEAALAANPLAGQTFLLPDTFRGRFDPPVALG